MDIHVLCLHYLFGPVETGHSPVLRPSLFKEVPLELQSLSSPQITETTNEYTILNNISSVGKELQRVWFGRNVGFVGEYR